MNLWETICEWERELFGMREALIVGRYQATLVLQQSTMVLVCLFICMLLYNYRVIIDMHTCKDAYLPGKTD